MMTEKRVCFIGADGHGGFAYSEIKELEGIKFCGAAPGCDKEGIPEFARGVMPEFSNWKEMLEAVQPDVAVVSTVFGLNAAITIECCRRGIDVFTEKPVAGTLEELSAVENAVRESGVRIGAMHYMRYTPSFYHAQKAVAGGAVGEIKMMTAQKSYIFGTRPDWYKNRGLYTGTIPWVGIHAIDWLWHFSGKRFLSVSAVQSGNPERAALCGFKMEGGVFASLNIDFYRPFSMKTHGDDRIRVVGTDGIMEVFDDRYVLLDKNGTHELAPKTAPKLTVEFMLERPTLTSDEIFMLTRTALLAREAADTGKEVAL